MRRAQIYLEDTEYEALRLEAFRRRRSLSSILRELVRIRLMGKPKNRNPAKLLDEIIGMVHETRPDVSERHDDYLWGEVK